MVLNYMHISCWCTHEFSTWYKTNVSPFALFLVSVFLVIEFVVSISMLFTYSEKINITRWLCLLLTRRWGPSTCSVAIERDIHFRYHNFGRIHRNKNHECLCPKEGNLENACFKIKMYSLFPLYEITIKMWN